MTLTYMDGNKFGYHEEFLKKTSENISIPSFTVTFVSKVSDEEMAFFIDAKNENRVEIESGITINDYGILFTNGCRVEVKSQNNYVYRLKENSEFSLENTIEGVKPVLFGNIYMFGTKKTDPIIDGGKYRTSCYTNTGTGCIVKNSSYGIDVYYSLDWENDIYEYDEKGHKFNIESMGKYSKIKLHADFSKEMRKRYKVLSEEIMKDEEINDLVTEFINPIYWR